MQFENPAVLGLIIPATIVGLYMMRKAKRKELIISRIIVAALLITAFASPFVLVPRVTTDENPNLVIISDETASMALFENGTSSELYEALTVKTPASLVTLTGDNTALGDAIVQYSTGDNQLVLVTDGNSNTGEDVESALQFAQETGTTVYLVQPDLENNDLTVQIDGDKTVVRNNENQFDIVVSQALDEEVTYSYELYSDDTLIRSGTRTFTDREDRIPVTQVKFSKLGAHTLKATITPEGSDVDKINNVFYKSVYAIPKSKIRAINLDTNSPLGGILLDLYDVSHSSGIDNIDNKKAIVVDNTHARSFTEEEVQELKDYLNEGRGIVFVGGDGSYNFGDYLDSSIEEILPVISKPTDWSGGRNVVMILDMSPSTLGGTQPTLDKLANESEREARRQTDLNIHETIIANALAVLNDEELRDANLGVIAFGTDAVEVSYGLEYLGSASTLERLEQDITKLYPDLESETSLDQGLLLAYEMISGTNTVNEVIIITDGEVLGTSEEAIEAAKLLGDIANIYFIHTSQKKRNVSPDSQLKHFLDEVGAVYINVINGERINLDFEDIEETPDVEVVDEETQLSSYTLVELNTKHFITKNIDVNGSITGYNDVTPKAGADRLIITNTGKPVLTTWRYGLGRVAALSTDNGQGGNNLWATQLYSDNNSKLISSTVNWVIGNPREETGAVVEAPDMWFGTPETIELTMYDEGIPTLKLDGSEVDLSLTGKNVYEAVINPSPIGVHDLSGYPVAVNYALEYRDVGLNDDLPVLIKAYGGTTYTSVSEARSKLFTEAQGNSEKLVRDSISQKIYFLIAALIVFLGEVILRRIREIKEMKKLETEVRT